MLDRNGRVVDPATINWQAVGNRPPYTFRQGPGPQNALGRIKFMFPNPHSVFLHDTPARGLFDQPERNFSSGCIRVEDPLSLAEIVLGDPGRWNRATLEAAIDDGKTRTVRLPEALAGADPVLDRGTGRGGPASGSCPTATGAILPCCRRWTATWSSTFRRYNAGDPRMGTLPAHRVGLFLQR